MSDINSNEYLADYSKKDQNWDSHKTSTVKVNQFYASSAKDHHQRYAVRIQECAEWLRFKFIDNENGESKLKLRQAHFCKVRLCPVCQWRRSMAWRARMFQRMPTLLESYKNLNFLFLTLTVKNCNIEDLSQELTVMNESFARLRKRAEFQKSVLGFIRATEVTKSKDGSAHPHFHCIVAVNKNYFRKKENFITTERWSELWKDCLKSDYYPIVDARKIRMSKDGQMESKAIIETLKYTTKVKDLLDDKDWFLTLSDQLFKKRFIATGGIFKNLLSEELSDKEMLLLEETKEQQEEDIEELKTSLYFGYKKSERRYKRIPNPNF